MRDKHLQDISKKFRGSGTTYNRTALQDGPVETFIGQVLGSVRVDSSKRVIEEKMLGIGVDCSGEGNTSFLTTTNEKVNKNVINSKF